MGFVVVGLGPSAAVYLDPAAAVQIAGPSGLSKSASLLFESSPGLGAGLKAGPASGHSFNNSSSAVFAPFSLAAGGGGGSGGSSGSGPGTGSTTPTNSASTGVGSSAAAASAAAAAAAAAAVAGGGGGAGTGAGSVALASGHSATVSGHPYRLVTNTQEVLSAAATLADEALVGFDVEGSDLSLAIELLQFHAPTAGLTFLFQVSSWSDSPEALWTAVATILSTPQLAIVMCDCVRPAVALMELRGVDLSRGTGAGSATGASRIIDLQLAARALGARPDCSLNEVLALCGFAPALMREPVLRAMALDRAFWLRPMDEPAKLFAVSEVAPLAHAYHALADELGPARFHHAAVETANTIAAAIASRARSSAGAPGSEPESDGTWPQHKSAPVPAVPPTLRSSSANSLNASGGAGTSALDAAAQAPSRVLFDRVLGLYVADSGASSPAATASAAFAGGSPFGRTGPRLDDAASELLNLLAVHLPAAAMATARKALAWLDEVAEAGATPVPALSMMCIDAGRPVQMRFDGPLPRGASAVSSAVGRDWIELPESAGSDLGPLRDALVALGGGADSNAAQQQPHCSMLGVPGSLHTVAVFGAASGKALSITLRLAVHDPHAADLAQDLVARALGPSPPSMLLLGAASQAKASLLREFSVRLGAAMGFGVVGLDTMGAIGGLGATPVQAVGLARWLPVAPHQSLAAAVADAVRCFAPRVLLVDGGRGMDVAAAEAVVAAAGAGVAVIVSVPALSFATALALPTLKPLFGGSDCVGEWSLFQLAVEVLSATEVQIVEPLTDAVAHVADERQLHAIARRREQNGWLYQSRGPYPHAVDAAFCRSEARQEESLA